MKIKYVSLFVLLAFSFVRPQSNEWFPGKLNIQPFTANILEPKLGFLFHLSKNELGLNIGNSLDLFHFHAGENETFSIGADFFTYTLLRGEKDFHFPVDAVDYLFGINAGYKKEIDGGQFGARFRLSHISAHFVDGHYDGINRQWRDGLNPRVYSREFVELTPYYKTGSLRLYAGVTYLFHVDPSFIGKENFQFGFDYFAEDLLSSSVTPFVAYDLKTVKIGKLSANNSIMVGLKFGRPSSKGFSAYLHYYSGKSVYGEYFDFNKSYSAFGINLDL